MSISPGISGLKEKLPSNKSGSYKNLISLTQWLLEDSSDKEFRVADVAPAIGLEGHEKRLGCLLRSLGLHSRKSTVNGKRGNLWSRKQLFSLLHLHGVVYKDKSGTFSLNRRITGDFYSDVKLASVYPFKSNKPCREKTIDVNLLFHPTFGIRPYHNQEIQHWEEEWSKRFNGKSFSSSLLVVQTMLDNVTVEDLGAIVSGQPDHCWISNNSVDDKGYSHVTTPWIKSALPQSGILPKDLPSTGAHRLVMMVQMPGLDWKDARLWYQLTKKEHGFLAHHTCFSRSCINPNHIEPVTREQHEAIHKRIDTNASRRIIASIVNRIPEAANAA